MAAFTGGAALACPHRPARGPMQIRRRPTMTPSSARRCNRKSFSFKKTRVHHSTNPPYDSDDRSRLTRSPDQARHPHHRARTEPSITCSPRTRLLKDRQSRTCCQRGSSTRMGHPGLKSHWPSSGRRLTRERTPTARQDTAVQRVTGYQHGRALRQSRSLPAPLRRRLSSPRWPDGDYFELASGGTKPAYPYRSIRRFPSNLPNAPVDMSRSISYNDYASRPGAPFLPDVAAARLQREGRHAIQSERLSE